MTFKDVKSIRVNLRIVLKTNIDPNNGLYQGSKGRVVFINYFVPNIIESGIKSVLIKFDHLQENYLLNSIKSYECTLDQTYLISEKENVLPIGLETNMTMYHNQGQ